MLIHRAVVAGLGTADIAVADGVIREVAPSIQRRRGEDVIDAAGGHVLPGLHDHHVHLRALAAAGGSVAAGPPDVTTRTELVAALAHADRDLPPGGWLRAVGYHESVAGDIDRSYLDAVIPNRPARVQHRSGILWILNSAGLALLDAAGSDRPGIERDAQSIPTGRLWREDGWLRHRLPPRILDLASLSRAAAAAGITGFTDATPHDDHESLATLSAAAAEGTIVQRLHLMSALGIDSPTGGPVKFLLDDDRLPTLDDLTARDRRGPPSRPAGGGPLRHPGPGRRDPRRAAETLAATRGIGSSTAR